MVNRNLDIVFWDVQHGKSTYIRTPDGKHIVQDLGTGKYSNNNSEFSPLLYLKNKYKVQQLNLVVITHPHKDHVDDIMNFEKLNPKTFSRPKNLSKDKIMKDVRNNDKKLFEKYFEIDKRYNEPAPYANSPRNPVNNGGAKIKSFYPKNCSDSNINNHSTVTVVSYAGVKVILSGDNTPCCWKELIENHDGFIEAIKDADILLAPHHGRESGWYENLFDYFEPKLTIISDKESVETSFVDEYRKKTTGLNVKSRGTGNIKKRKCLTTRSDGAIFLSIGSDGSINATIK